MYGSQLLNFDMFINAEFAVVMQEFYKFLNRMSGIPTVNLMNIVDIADPLFCEVSLN